MKRSSSLDFVRGGAALTVAIPHYVTLNSDGHTLAEAVAVCGVEVFFVLSGFVLAPQIVRAVVGKPWRNLGVFLVRRWMRTVPPYLVALLFVAVMTGHLLTGDFLRYLFYVQNLFKPANHADFYPVAWSLAVEEWFYLLFAPILFLLTRAFKRADRRFERFYAFGFIGVIVALRLALAPADWDLGVRRVTVFRVDSIAWGFLLYLALESRAAAAVSETAGKLQLAFSAAVTAAVATAGLTIAFLALGGHGLARQVFPYSAAALGMSCIWLAYEASELFEGRIVRSVCFFLGRVSYSLYLFHLLVAMALKPAIGAWPLAAQLSVYLLVLGLLSTVFWYGLEGPVLAARPDYAPKVRQVAPTPSPTVGTRLSIAFLLGAAAVLGLALWAFKANFAVLFNLFLFVAAASTLLFVEGTRRVRTGWSLTLTKAWLLFSLFLPVADGLAARLHGAVAPHSDAKPTYLFRKANSDPAAFNRWWDYYVAEWDRGKSTIEAPDPLHRLPFIFIPNSSARFFDSTISINNLGFRNPEFERDKRGQFRIFVLGESVVMGPMLSESDRPWPAHLQELFTTRATCDRPVEVINAGTEAHSLEDNLERMRRFILPLQPDLIVSYHGINGFDPLGLMPKRTPRLNEPRPRLLASPLIATAIYRFRRAIYEWERSRMETATPALLSDDELLKSRYADDYRSLVALAKQAGAHVALSSSSMAVNRDSPPEVKAFYSSMFTNLDDLIAANAAHNRIVRQLGAQLDAPFIDMTPGMDGKWDDDLYLDLVHFTDNGTRKIAEIEFLELVPILGRYGLHCSISETALPRVDSPSR